MATYAIGAAETATHRTLAAATVDTVTFTGRRVEQVSILVHPSGTDPVWVTVDGTTPAVSGATSHPIWPGNAAVLPGGLSSNVLDGMLGDAANTPTVVKLISAGTPTYTVEE